MLSLKIAARFLKTSPGQSALIIAGIAVGIATQVFVGSLITSLQADLIDTTVGSSPHVTLLPPDGEATLPGAYAGRVLDAEPLTTEAVAVRDFSAIYADGDESLPLSVKGGDAAGIDGIYGLSGRLVEGAYSLADDEILVGLGFADSAGVGAGDEISLLLPDGRTDAYTVSGVFDLGAAAANERLAFTGAQAAADALGQAADEYSAIELQLSDVFASTEVAERLASELDAEAVDWQETNQELLSGLQAQSGSSAMIQVFVLVAVALGIASTLAISAVQKTRQIGILKAMGMGDGPAGRIFLWQAALLGAGGTTAGIVLGYALIWGFSFAPVPFSIRPEPQFIAISAVVGVSVALASSIIPARKTSRLDPIEVIQSG
ncbi:MAG: ABC transporter permease [Coriobacteriia bacterium]